MSKITLPAQTVPVDTPLGVDPVWYERLQQIAAIANLFAVVDLASLADGQSLIWDATEKRFRGS